MHISIKISIPSRKAEGKVYRNKSEMIRSVWKEMERSGLFPLERRESKRKFARNGKKWNIKRKSAIEYSYTPFPIILGTQWN